MNIELSNIDKIAGRVADIYRNKLTDYKLGNSNLANTASVQVEFNGTLLVISMNLEEYWKYVEYGRRPMKKFPPPTAIREWIKTKRIVPNPVNGKVPSTESLVYLISRKIARDGIPPKRALTETVYSTEFEAVIEDIKNEIKRQLMQQFLKDL